VESLGLRVSDLRPSVMRMDLGKARQDISESFALKVDSCQKSCRILDFLALPDFVGAPLPKVVPTLSRLPRSTSPGKVL